MSAIDISRRQLDVRHQAAPIGAMISNRTLPDSYARAYTDATTPAHANPKRPAQLHADKVPRRRCYLAHAITGFPCR